MVFGSFKCKQQIMMTKMSKRYKIFQSKNKGPEEDLRDPEVEYIDDTPTETKEEIAKGIGPEKLKIGTAVVMVKPESLRKPKIYRSRRPIR